MNNIEHNQDLTKDAEGQSRLTDVLCGTNDQDCETCEGKGTINEQLGGECSSNPKTICPDCDGRGYFVTHNIKVERGGAEN